ncbi:hypothetical protein G6F42_026579 [Rhizopus arrhizus]|nr:hypothetical protein G6F42_026579 [Rhizopus arrhizus]
MLSTSKLVRASPRLLQASRSLATTANAAPAAENKTILELPKTVEASEEFSQVFQGKIMSYLASVWVI